MHLRTGDDGNHAVAPVGGKKLRRRLNAVKVVDDDNRVEQVSGHPSGPFLANTLLVLESVPGLPDARRPA